MAIELIADLFITAATLATLGVERDFVLAYPTRLEEAADILRGYPMPLREKKRLLAHWMNENDTGYFSPERRRTAYDRLLGAYNNARLIG